MSDLLQKAEQHEFPHADVQLCMKPALIKERDQAMARVASAKTPQKSKVEDDRLATPAATGVSPALAAAIAEVKELNDQIQAASITLRIVGVDRVKYNRFMLANPPRKGRNEAYDSSKFFMYVARQTAVYVDSNDETHPITPQEWDVLDPQGGGGIIGDGEHDRIAQAVIDVNRVVGSVDPSFFVNGSETIPDSSETSD